MSGNPGEFCGNDFSFSLSYSDILALSRGQRGCWQSCVIFFSFVEKVSIVQWSGPFMSGSGVCRKLGKWR